MKLFFAMVLLSMANQHSDAVRLPALKATVANIPPGRQIILSQPIQEGPQNRSEASSREIAQALDQLNCHNDPMCFIQTAQSLAERGEQLDLALACVERAMAIPPVPNDAIPRESFFLTLAYVQIRRLEFDQAIATLTRGAQRSPEYARVDEYLTYLGLAYESSGRIDEAIETYVTLAGGLRDISREPSERLVALYRKRFGSLDGLKEKIDANRLKARKKFFVDSHLLDTPAPTWSLQDLDGRQFKLADFSKKILVVSFLDTGGNVQEPMLKFLQAQYESTRIKKLRSCLLITPSTLTPSFPKLTWSD